MSLKRSSSFWIRLTGVLVIAGAAIVFALPWLTGSDFRMTDATKCIILGACGIGMLIFPAFFAEKDADAKPDDAPDRSTK